MEGEKKPPTFQFLGIFRQQLSTFWFLGKVFEFSVIHFFIRKVVFVGVFFLWKAEYFHEKLNCAENPPKENFGKKNTAWNLLTFRKSPGPSIRTGPVGKCCHDVNGGTMGLPKHYLGCFLQGWMGTVLATVPVHRSAWFPHTYFIHTWDPWRRKLWIR